MKAWEIEDLKTPVTIRILAAVNGAFDTSLNLLDLTHNEEAGLTEDLSDIYLSVAKKIYDHEFGKAR